MNDFFAGTALANVQVGPDGVDLSDPGVYTLDQFAAHGKEKYRAGMLVGTALGVGVALALGFLAGSGSRR